MTMEIQVQVYVLMVQGAYAGVLSLTHCHTIEYNILIPHLKVKLLSRTQKKWRKLYLHLWCRCPTYPSLKDGCQLLTDPNDECCQSPLCVEKNPKNPYQVITAPKGQFTGGSQTPNGPLGQNPNLVSRSSKFQD